jgi:hypothetical protein
VRPPSQRRALGALFLCLTLAFAGIAIAAAWGAAGAVGRWVVVFAAAAIAAWFGSLAWRTLGPH